MSRNSTRRDDWVRIFEVPCFEKHEKGYTVYKIISRVFPYQCPEASTQVTVWKRFSEFDKLHKEMSSLHAALYLKGKFPPLSKASFFSRFDSAVIEDRRAEILAALEFVALHPPLFTSAPFTRFFEDGNCRTVREIDSLPPALSPQLSITDSDVSSPTASDVIPPGGDVTQPAGAFSDLDPLSPGPPGAAADSGRGPSNLQLLSEPPQPDLLSHLHSAPSPPSGQPSVDTPSDSGEELPYLSCDDSSQGDDPGPGPDPGPLDLSRLALDGQSDLPAVPDDPPELPSVPPSPPDLGDVPRPPTGASDTAPLAATDPATLPYPADSGSCPPPAPAPAAPAAGGTAAAAQESAGRPGPPDAGQYLITAADAISRAQQAESQCLWNLAFSHYQEGIGALINGVQGDPSAERREAVRRKTAMYIGRAEQLAALCCDTPPEPRRRRLSHLCVEGGQPLGRYKVVGVTAAGHLKVTDRHAGAAHRYLIKVVVKCACAPDSPHADTVLPERVPHMVQLHRLVETETAYYLVLQYLPHGLLWDSLAGLGSSQAASDTAAAPSASPPAPAAAPVSPAEPPAPAPPEPRACDGRPTDGPADAAPDPAEPPDEPDSETMSSSYLQLFEDFAASARRSGSVSLARNLSCPGPDPDPDPDPESAVVTKPQPEPVPEMEAGLTIEPELKQEQGLERGLELGPVSGAGAERRCSDELCDSVSGLSVAGPTAAGGEGSSDGSPDRLLTRSQQLLSAVERTLKVTSRRQREPAQTAASRVADTRDNTGMESDGRGAVTARRDGTVTTVRPVSEVARVTDSDVASSDGGGALSGPRDTAAAVSAGGEPDRGVCPPAAARVTPEQEPADSTAPRRRRPTLDDNWWSRDGGEEEDSLAPRPQPQSQSEPTEPPAAGPSRPSEEQLRLWTAQLVSALDRLHQQGVVCRDLRPENVLLTADGGVCLTYFCRLRAAGGRRRPAPAGRHPLYTAPELSAPGRPASPAADWWSLGALLWELHGEGPLWRRHPAGLAEHTALHLPAGAPPAARSLLTALLQPDPHQRPDASQIRRHEFFSGLDWDRL